MIRRIGLATVAAVFALGLAACDNKGPAEQVGEEVDEAVDTIRNGGESTGNKIDDAVDEMREGAQDAADEVRN
jgi:predicted small lipoprotein YifL